MISGCRGVDWAKTVPACEKVERVRSIVRDAQYGEDREDETPEDASHDPDVHDLHTTLMPQRESLSLCERPTHNHVADLDSLCF